MFSRVISSTVLFSALFSLVMGVIRALPYDDHAMRELLLPDGCPAPCFMGIRPGITTTVEAIKRLQSSGWVADIQRPTTSTWIIIRWNDQAPSWFARDYGNYMALVASGDLVDEIHMQTMLRLADVELLLGRSTLREMVLFKGAGEGQFIPNLNFSMAYPQYSLMLGITAACTVGGRIGYDSRNVTLYYYADMSKFSDYLKQFNDSWGDITRTRC